MQDKDTLVHTYKCTCILTCKTTQSKLMRTHTLVHTHEHTSQISLLKVHLDTGGIELCILTSLVGQNCLQLAAHAGKLEFVNMTVKVLIVWLIILGWHDLMMLKDDYKERCLFAPALQPRRKPQLHSHKKKIFQWSAVRLSRRIQSHSFSFSLICFSVRRRAAYNTSLFLTTHLIGTSNMI